MANMEPEIAEIKAIDTRFVNTPIFIFIFN